MFGPFPIVTKIAVVALTLAATPILAVSLAHATPVSEKFAQETVDRGYVILNNNELAAAQRSQQVRDFMLGITDIRRIALFTLGQYVNSVTPADQDDFVAAFSDYATAVYETRLSKYKGQTLRVTGSNDRATDDSVVNMIVVNPNAQGGNPIRAAFRVRNGANGRPVITDMQVEGVWLAINQRSDFIGFLQQNRGSAPALSANLRQQVKPIRGSQGGQ